MANIIFITENISNLGGIEKITSLIANELVSEHKICILSVYNRSSSNPKYKLKGQISILNLKNKNKIFKLFEAKKIINKFKTNFVIIQGKNLYYFAYLKHLTKSKIIFVDHDSVKAYPVNQKNENKPRKVASKKADFIVSLTEENKSEYIERFAVPSKKIVVIPNFIDANSNPTKYNANSKTIVAVGRYHIQKRFDLLIRAFSIIADKYPDWNIKIYGEGELRQALQELIIKNNLNKRITLCGEFKNRDEAYLDKAFLCLTSQHEGFGLVLLEGFAYKLPAISFNCPSGPSEIIRNNSNGFLVKSYDINEFAHSIEKLIINKNLRIEFSNNTEKTLSVFNKETIIEKWKQLFKISLR